MVIEGIAGIITGFAGNIFTSWNNRKAKKEESEYAIKLLKAQTEANIAQSQADIAISKNKVEGEITKAEFEAFKQTITESNTTSFKETYMEQLFKYKAGAVVGIVIAALFGISDFARSIARPLITLFLVGLTAWIIKESVKLEPNIENLIVYLATTAVVWWFGYRNDMKYEKLRNTKPTE